MKGLRFGLPPTKVDKFSIFATFETCYSNFKDENISGGFTEEIFRNKFADNACTVKATTRRMNRIYQRMNWRV